MCCSLSRALSLKFMKVSHCDQYGDGGRMMLHVETWREWREEIQSVNWVNTVKAIQNLKIFPNIISWCSYQRRRKPPESIALSKGVFYCTQNITIWFVSRRTDCFYIYSSLNRKNINPFFWQKSSRLFTLAQVKCKIVKSTPATAPHTPQLGATEDTWQRQRRDNPSECSNKSSGSE